MGAKAYYYMLTTKNFLRYLIYQFFLLFGTTGQLEKLLIYSNSNDVVIIFAFLVTILVLVKRN